MRPERLATERTWGYGMRGEARNVRPRSAGIQTMIETVQLGRNAMERHAWVEAIEAFAAADRAGGLAPGDLEMLGTAAWRDSLTRPPRRWNAPLPASQVLATQAMPREWRSASHIKHFAARPSR
jgi:hypothetical protein